jgi:mannose-6-phosphate isomerase-like protein (cupin superfamily)
VTHPWWASSLADAIAALSLPQADRAHYLIRNQSMRVGVYAPVASDDQTSHAQDEIYIIVGGAADFTKDRQTIAVKTGDVLFVEAGSEHRFDNMRENFATWVIFWGPYGGEGRTGSQQ